EIISYGTSGAVFTLLVFSDYPELVFFFLLFLSIYGVTVWEDLGMIALIQVSSELHTPMYFFLSHLSFVDFCYSTISTPKMIANILKEDKIISFQECTVQFYLFCTFGVTEVILLAVMAYDCCVAICDPPLYMVTMSRNLCVELVTCGYLNATVCSVIHLCLALQIPSYRSNVINHFFCDLPPLLSLACSDVTVNQLVLYIVAIFSEIITSVIILISYLFVLITILRMHSAEGRCKAFSTCASHLAAIAVLQETILSWDSKSQIRGWQKGEMVDSVLEVEEQSRRGYLGVSLFDSFIPDSMDMSLSKLQETGKDKEA
uniref:G-protein coupled receptors family 1 profile domain-containing protein n=1 Tax=Bos indicus x Bos taurus TaxID=30522 RepID=A0A4W2GQF4_BOBOX